MRLLSLPGLLGAASILLTSVVPVTQGVDLTPIPPPNLDLSQLGHVALVGDFDAISFYNYQSQSESGSLTNGTESIVIPMANGGYATVASADGHINAMCPFIMKSGVLAGIIVGGNFTSLGGSETVAAALIDPNKGTVTPLSGLSGQVNAILCDQDTNSVFFGGDIKGGNSTNAIAWVGMTGWTNLPFAGFNGPVSSITKAPNGHIIFGGSFEGLGNSTTPARIDGQGGQVINISSAKILTGGETTTAGFSDAKSILCKNTTQAGPGNSWLLANGRPGFWQANMNFGYIPTKLRMTNTNQNNHSTKTFRFTALPIGGIMNFTYTDPSSGKELACDARCPLSNDTSQLVRDFKFVNPIGMSGFRIDISDWYGDGGGLDGIELFEDDIFAYAVNDFNEPSCGDIKFPSKAIATGPWTVSPAGQTPSQYLTATVGGSNTDPLSVVFEPDIKQSGNYSVILYTPGCVQDETCASRGIVTVNATLTSQAGPKGPASTQIYQTNMFDKYDSIFLGSVDASSGSFRPSVTLTPQVVPGQPMKVVASKIKFQPISSGGGLNGLFDYDPNKAVVNTDFSSSAIDRAGTDLNEGASVTALDVHDSIMYVGGNFSTSTYENIMSFSSGKASSLPDGGLDAGVAAMFDLGDLLYVGGNFTDTSKGGFQGLNRIAGYSFSKKAWQALGAGLNGQVLTIAPLPLNITVGQPETTIALGGNFDKILAFGSNPSVSVDGLAVWVPSKSNWLQNLDTAHPSLHGKVVASTNNPKNVTLIAGTLSSSGWALSGAASLTSSSGNLGLGQIPVKIKPQQAQSSLQKRALGNKNVTGVATGYYYENGGRNITCLGGHFTATTSNGSIAHNLVMLNGSDHDTVVGMNGGLATDSIILSLETQGDILFAGGMVSGSIDGTKVEGIVSYDLLRSEYTSTQPPALAGDDVVVNAISPRPDTTEIYVGGNFNSAGSLDCTGLCMYDTATSQWNRVGSAFSGTVEALAWGTKDKLIAAGNLTLANNATTMAEYDAKKEEWTVIKGASSLPGPVSAICQGSSDATHFWVAGQASNGSSFLVKYDGSAFLPVGDVFGKQTTIRGLQMLALTASHANSALMDKNHVLLLTGQLDLPNFGNASAALFNGTDFTPFILSSTQDGSPASMAKLIASQQKFFPTTHGGHSLTFVVFISMLCALGCLFLIIIIGVIIDRIQRRNNGYIPAPTYTDKNSNVGRIRPEELFQSLGRGGKGRGPGDPPMV